MYVIHKVEFFLLMSTAVREGLPEGLVAFVCLDSPAEGGVLSGHINFHSCCFMVV